MYKLNCIYTQYNNGHGTDALDQLKNFHFGGRLCIMALVLNSQETANMTRK